MLQLCFCCVNQADVLHIEFRHSNKIAKSQYRTLGTKWISVFESDGDLFPEYVLYSTQVCL